MATRPLVDEAAVAAARAVLAIARKRFPSAQGWLYGSHARGEARKDSDVDLAIVVDTDPQTVQSLGDDLAGDSFDLLLQTGYLVSPFTLTLEQWRTPESLTNPFLIRNMRRDGIAL